MPANPRFYAVIIGTEILNARREDKHFAFLRDALQRRGFTLFSAQVIKDDPWLIAQAYSLVQNDPQGVMFSFGGIGATPDDLTRQIASEIFTGKGPVRHAQFEHDIIERFGDDAYPHRIHMAQIPEGSQLLKNPVNNMSGFFLEERYFFVPGFPEMAHPMVEEALTRFYPQNTLTYRKTFIAQTSENTLIDLMKVTPPQLELSSLPMLRAGHASVELSLASGDESEVESWFKRYTDFLDQEKIDYTVSR